MRRTLAVLITSTAFAAISAPAALAGSGNPSPTGTGPPSQTCQNLETTNVLPSLGAANSPGSVFNEAGLTGSNGTVSSGGTGGNAYNAVGAPSQYDVACYQTSIHH